MERETKYERDMQEGPSRLSPEEERRRFDEMSNGFLGSLIIHALRPNGVTPSHQLTSFVRRDQAVGFLDTTRLSPFVALVTKKKSVKENGKEGMHQTEVEFVTALSVAPNAHEYADGLIAMLTPIATQGQAARYRLIDSHLGLVTKIAGKFIERRRSLDLSDLTQAGCLGLMKAISKYDWRRGFEFSTYAAYWIKKAINRSIDNTARMIRLPIHVVEKMSDIHVAHQELQQLLQRTPTHQEVADKLGISLAQVSLCARASYLDTVCSLDAQIGENGDDAWCSLIRDPEVQNPEDVVLQKDVEQTVIQVVENLSPVERKVICAHYGIPSNGSPSEEKTIKQTAEELGMNYNTVAGILARAHKKLQTNRTLQESAL